MTNQQFIQNLNQENSIFNSVRQAEMMASLLDTVSKDIYSEAQRFVFELIQNADDAATSDDNQVTFQFISNCLIISHNGKPFDEQDVIGLTSAGASTKKSDPTKTGYKGIGFKSVFGQSKKVFVFSNGYQFRFDKSTFTKKMPWQSIPIWTELSDLPDGVAQSLTSNQFNVSTIVEVTNLHQLGKELEALLANGELLLFLRRIRRITVIRADKSNYLVEKQIKMQTSQYDEVDLVRDSRLLSNWIIKRYDNIPVPDKTSEELNLDESTPEKLRDSKVTEIVFATRIQNGKIKRLTGEQSLIFTFLPTKVSEFQFPFLVNSTFLTNASRETLHQDQVWNQWLFGEIAEKITDWFELLATSQYRHQTLHLMPDSFQNSTNQLKKIFEQHFTENIKSKKFIISKGNTICAGTSLIHDKTGLSDLTFIPSDSVIEFVNSAGGTTFKGDCFVNSNTEEVSKLSRAGATMFELQDLSLFFVSESFVSRHQVSDNFALIQYLKSKSDADKEGMWFQTLRTLPFIFDENNILQCPYNGICFPIGIASTELGNVPVIHPAVFEKIKGDKIVFEWLKKLGVKEPSNAAFITNVIIPGIKRGNYINAENYIQITHFLFRLFNSNALDNEMLEGLRELPVKIKKDGFVLSEAQNCFLSNRYRPLLEIEGTISSDVNFVSEDYLFDGSKIIDWNRFFKAIKVKDQVEIEIINENNSLPTIRKITSDEWVDGCRVEIPL